MWRVVPGGSLGSSRRAVGRVISDALRPLYLVEWNQFTLDNMHPIFRKRCERGGLEETNSWLGQEDLEADLGEAMPLEQATQIVTRPLNTRRLKGCTAAYLEMRGGQSRWQQHRCAKLGLHAHQVQECGANLVERQDRIDTSGLDGRSRHLRCFCCTWLLGDNIAAHPANRLNTVASLNTVAGQYYAYRPFSVVVGHRHKKGIGGRTSVMHFG